MEPMDVSFALIVFEHTGGGRGSGDATSTTSGEPWADEVASIEHQRRDRIVVGVTFAGHYVNADDEGDFIGAKTAEGAEPGAAAGLLFGAAGPAVGLVGGGMAGDVTSEHSGPRLRSALFDELCNEAPQGFSAGTLMAAPGDVDAMVSALKGHDGRLARRHLTPEDAQPLRSAVAGSPSAAPRPTG